MSGNDSFEWGYFPPQDFKILLYFPDDGSFIVSESQETYAFNSKYSVKVNNGEITVLRGGSAAGYVAEIVGFLLRIVITIALELGVAAIFGYRAKKAVMLILIVNIVTQLLLNIALNIANFRAGLFEAALIYIGLELLIFLIEAGVYAAVLPKLTEGATGIGKAVLYSLAANAASFLIGGMLAVFQYGVSEIFV